MSYALPEQSCTHPNKIESAAPVRLSLPYPQIKIPEVNYPQFGDSSIDFQLQVYKLVQANTVLGQLIKKAINDKYSISQKIIKVNEQIKKLEAKNNK